MTHLMIGCVVCMLVTIASAVVMDYATVAAEMSHLLAAPIG